MREIASVSIDTMPLFKVGVAGLRFIGVLINVASQLCQPVSKLALESIRTSSSVCPFPTKGSFYFVPTVPAISKIMFM